MNKVMIKILQGSVVTQTVLGGLTVYPLFANLLKSICAKNCESWLAADKVIVIIKWCDFLEVLMCWQTALSTRMNLYSKQVFKVNCLPV